MKLDLTYILTKLVSFIYRAMIVVILAVLVMAGRIPYSQFHRRDFIAPNYVLIIVGVLFLLLLKKLVSGFDRKNVKILPISLVLLIVSVIVSLLGMYVTGWDAGDVFGDARAFSSGGSIDADYYSINPNNRLILVVFINILRPVARLLSTDSEIMYGALVIVQCIIFWLAGLMVYDILRSMGTKNALLGYIIYNIFVGLGPWPVIAYTDGYGIIFPVLMLWLFVKIPEKTWYMALIKWLLILLTAVIGYHIKATSTVMLIALIASFMISVFKHISEKGTIISLVIVLLISILAIPCFKISDKLVESAYETTTGEVTDHDKSLAPFHYLMLGLNAERDGTVNSEDVYYSIYIDDYDERVSANKSKIKERVKTLGISGLSGLFTRKLTLNYNDGTLGYGLSGESFMVQRFRQDSILNGWVRFFYWPDHGGFDIFLNSMQILWLGMIFFSLLYRIKNRNDCAVALSLLGITAFTMLFEAQQRYLLVFAPIYVIAAVNGLKHDHEKRVC